MEQAYASQTRAETSSARAAGKRAAAPSASADMLRARVAASAGAPPGTPVDLPGAIRAKFENSFGADLSALRLYRSQAVADAGARAVAQGNRIAFAPGVLDFTSRSGQALLGHEISHVVSQQRGEVRGGGFLNDSALEARADREGAMAAAGARVAAPTAPLSVATAGSAAGPMQAKKEKPEDTVLQSGEMPLLPEDDSAQGSASAPQQAPAAPQQAPAAAGGAPAEAEAMPETYNDAFAAMTGKPVEAIQNVSDFSSDKGMKAFMAGDMEGAMGTLKTANQLGTASAAMGLGSGVMGLGGLLMLQEMAGDKGSKATSTNLKLGSTAAGLGVGAAGLGLGAQISMGNALSAAGGGDLEGAQKSIGLTGTLGKAAGGIAIGAQVLGLGANVNSLVDATKIKKKMSSNAAELQAQKDKGEPLSDNQEMMRKIYKQSAGQAKVNQISSSFDIAKGALGLGGTVASMSGAGLLVGKGLEWGSKLVGGIGKGVTDYEKEKLHNATVDEELDIKNNTDSYAQDEDTAHIWDEIGEDERKAAFLRHSGYGSGTVDEAFQGITQKRANYILNDAKAEDRDKFLEDANIAKDEDPSKPSMATQMAVLMNLGGDPEAKKYADKFSDENDDFLANRKQREEDEANGVGVGGRMARGLKGFGKKLLGSVATAGLKIASIGKGVWRGMKAAGSGIKKGALAAGRGIKKGALAAGRGIKSFVTDADTRKSVGQSIKSGFLKAGRGIKSGFGKMGRGIVNGYKSFGRGLVGNTLAAGNGLKSFFTNADTRKSVGQSIKSGFGKVGRGIVGAGKYVGGLVKTQTNKVKNWYNRGMEQLVMNKGNYDKMYGWDRFKWSMKNLPARLAYNSQKARDKTANRLADTLKAQALMRYTDEKRKNKAS